MTGVQTCALPIFIKDYSWRAVFAADQAEYDKIVAEMKDIVVGLGYNDVLEYDLQNVEGEKQARIAVTQ